MVKCETLSCTFSGTPEKQGLCSVCFKRAGGAAGAAAGAPPALPPAARPPAARPASAADEEAAALAAALAESAAMHTASVDSPVVDASRAFSRAHASRPSTVLTQVGTLNQFHRQWSELIREHAAPAAICGYTAPANAILLARRPAAAGAAFAAPAAAREALLALGFEAAAPLVRDAMAFVRASRARYVAAHAADFGGAVIPSAAAAAYESAWVANFELSDFLRSLDPETARHILFVRFNQMPSLHEATHEERARIVEEETPFGGAWPAEGAAAFLARGGAFSAEDAAATAAPAAYSPFIVEVFARPGSGATAARDRRLLRPAEALALPARERAAWRVAVVDLSGHFAVSVLAGAPPAACCVNTTEANYLEGRGAVHELVHELLVSGAEAAAALEAAEGAAGAAGGAAAEGAAGAAGGAAAAAAPPAAAV